MRVEFKAVCALLLVLLVTSLVYVSAPDGLTPESYTTGNSMDGSSSGMQPLAVVSCLPDEGYDYCYDNSYTYYDARAYAKIQATAIQGESGTGIIEGVQSRYYLDEAYINVKHTGDRFTVLKGATSWASCSDIGCSGSNVADGKYVIASAPAKNPSTLYFSSWDKDTDRDGYWGWTAVRWGWVQNPANFNFYVVDCYNDADCGDGYYCDKSGSWDTWGCEVDLCAYSPAPENTCVGYDLYSQSCYHGEDVLNDVIKVNSPYCGYVCEEGATQSYICNDETRITRAVCESNEWVTVDENPAKSCPVNFANLWEILQAYFKGLIG
jgi:hypothetical protein